MRKDEALHFICSHWSRHGPDLPLRAGELADALGVSKSRASNIICELHMEGCIARARNLYLPTEKGIQRWQEQRGLVPLPQYTVASSMAFDEVEQIAAGAMETKQTYPVSLHAHPRTTEDLFVLTVQGDAMDDGHILDGDTLLVRRFRGNRPHNGQLVVAGVRTSDQTLAVTLKHFHYDAERRTVELRPANPEYKSMFVAEEDVLILGTPIRVIRDLE